MWIDRYEFERLKESARVAEYNAQRYMVKNAELQSAIEDLKPFNTFEVLLRDGTRMKFRALRYDYVSQYQVRFVGEKNETVGTVNDFHYIKKI